MKPLPLTVPGDGASLTPAVLPRWFAPLRELLPWRRDYYLTLGDRTLTLSVCLTLLPAPATAGWMRVERVGPITVAWKLLA